ncbi:MAG TPA: glycoside hydrolase family 3 N-terminal domain-containing protein, partial [Actinoplanes sp.]|nr:glycoside hydrolase family 3 N-terminal domain-containing protein [Actinoplanes sp.]
MTLPAARSLTLAQQVSLLSGGDFWRTRPLPEVGIPSAVLSDGPHGLRFQADGAEHLGMSGSEQSTCFPTAVTIASSWDEELAEEIGRALAGEARALGVDVVLGPGLNIKRHPLCGRNFEYFSEDPLLTGRLAAAMVTGLQRNGVGACLKHFAVNNQ